MYGYIYMTTNKITGSLYVGKHKAQNTILVIWGAEPVFVRSWNNMVHQLFATRCLLSQTPKMS